MKTATKTIKENVVFQSSAFTTKFKEEIVEAVASNNVEEGEPFAILKEFAIIGLVKNGKVVVEKVLNEVI